MTTYAITVVGHDRPGIVADVTGALAAHAGNIEDSSMTLLRGHFAWTLIVRFDTSVAELEATVAPLARGDLVINVLPLPEYQYVDISDMTACWLTVHGSDRTGIVAATTRILAARGGNLTNLTTRLAGELYVITADVDLPSQLDLVSLAHELSEVGESLGVTVRLVPADSDVL